MDDERLMKQMEVLAIDMKWIRRYVDDTPYIAMLDQAMDTLIGDMEAGAEEWKVQIFTGFNDFGFLKFFQESDSEPEFEYLCVKLNTHTANSKVKVKNLKCYFFATSNF